MISLFALLFAWGGVGMIFGYHYGYRAALRRKIKQRRKNSC